MNDAPAPPPRGDVLVIGIGNADRGDDAVGPLVARRLRGRLPRHVRILEQTGDMLALIALWTDARAVILIDAAAPLATPGRVHRIDLAASPLPAELSLSSTHGFGAIEAVELARALGTLPAEVDVYAIEGACFDAGAALTPEVAAAAATVAEAIVTSFAEHRTPARPAVAEEIDH